MSKGTKVKNSSSVHPEAAGKVECEAEMGEQASECLSREETEHGPMDPSPQLPVSPQSPKRFWGRVCRASSTGDQKQSDNEREALCSLNKS